MTGTGVAASLTTLVTLGTAQPIRLGLHKRVQRILHRATDHTVQVTFDPLVINRDDIAQRTRCILCHGGSLLLAWLRLATSSSARFGAASPTQLCERFRTSSIVERPRKLPIAAALTRPCATDVVAGGFFLACWPVDRVIRHTVDADKHPVAAPTVLLIAASAGPVTSSTTNSGGTRHLNGTPLVPMPLVT